MAVAHDSDPHTSLARSRYHDGHGGVWEEPLRGLNPKEQSRLATGGGVGRVGHAIVACDWTIATGNVVPPGPRRPALDVKLRVFVSRAHAVTNPRASGNPTLHLRVFLGPLEHRENFLRGCATAKALP